MLPPGGGGGYSQAPPPFTSPFDRDTGFYNGAPKPSAFQAAAFGSSMDYAPQYSPTAQSAMRGVNTTQAQHPTWQQPPLTDPFGNARRIANPAAQVSSESLEPTSPATNPDEEAPLLQELGIVPKDILKRMFCVLTFHNVGDELLKSMDMTGPVLILMALATSLLITSQGSRIQFGHVYAMMTAGTTTLWALLNMMASTQYLLSFHRALSVFGYGLLPMVIGSILSPLVGRLKIYLIIVSVLWSTMTAGRFIDEALKMTNQRLLVAYPILLFYGCFALSL